MKNKTLHIVRHGKALQDYSYIQDDDRPLVEKGIINNIVVAKKFITLYSVPELIISSYAARALQTAHIFARTMNYPHNKIIACEELYLRGDKETYDILVNLNDVVRSVMVVGHNPDLIFLANRFAARINDLSTSSVVTISFETKRWIDIEKVKTKCSVLGKDS